MAGEAFWNTGATTSSTTVRDAGRWEVVVVGTPPEAVTTEDETDWLYYWVED